MTSVGSSALFESSIPGLELLGRGKVRDLYAIDDGHLLIVTSDRLSAFDVILPDPIPGKGAVLTRVSQFWFHRLAHIVPHHLVARALEDVLPAGVDPAPLVARSMVVRRLRPLPVEAVVRGYLAGSGWKDYQATGAVCGHALPAGLSPGARLPEPLFTPATKAAAGSHDENIDFAALCTILGEARSAEVRDTALALYGAACAHAEARGILIADTKFEFGLDDQDRLVWIDEALTPDSSRFWPADAWRPGEVPPSFDKQYVRDYLETLDWDKRAPGPRLPSEVIAQTAARYREAEERLCG
ncbi:MAG TPA: phosphoribosylaminoimidazolesuccinocarboxamide synthase [Gammaproteobacteria bacterium]|nr:phosphoribosylaminoimidazolesuccinocarboxamide synthase [Gammaproteobacteria bacterium]